VTGADDISFACPRCGEPVAARYYGPCAGCRAALHAGFAGDGRAVDTAAYEPKVNVTPNAVALRDD
jgi:hypothetical protein